MPPTWSVTAPERTSSTSSACTSDDASARCLGRWSDDRHETSPSACTCAQPELSRAQGKICSNAPAITPYPVVLAWMSWAAQYQVQAQVSPTLTGTAGSLVCCARRSLKSEVRNDPWTSATGTDALRNDLDRAAFICS